MFLTQLILANAAVAMIIGMSIVVLAITALEVHESGSTRKLLKTLKAYINFMLLHAYYLLLCCTNTKEITVLVATLLPYHK